MFEVTPDRAHNVVHFRLWGVITLVELADFGRQLDAVGLGFEGQPIKLLADVRGFVPATPEVADKIRGLQEAGMRAGVVRIAEIVESDVMALQLNRIARETGTYGMVRRFWDEESARTWLIAGDPAPAGTPGPAA